MENPDNPEQMFKVRFNNSVDKNFEMLKEFYEHNLMQMCEMTSLKNEILNCLLLELYQASIFSTNHFLERIIKVSLIKYHTREYNYSQIEEYTIKSNEAQKKFDSLKLFESLKLAFEYQLISPEEHTYLSTIKNSLRNPYSHAEISKINVNSPKNFRGFMFNIADI